MASVKNDKENIFKKAQIKEEMAKESLFNLKMDKVNASKKYKAVVMTPPSHQIKEQTLSNYGVELAENGFIALAFDYNSKGESESYHPNVRNDDNVPRKWEDLRNAISFLCSKAYVDEVFSLGICAGGNIASSVLITDLRVKALASVSAMMATDMMMFPPTDKNADTFWAMITAANASRQKMFELLNKDGADDKGEIEPDTMTLFGYDDPDYVKNNPNASVGQLEGFDYYGTARGGPAKYPRFTNDVVASLYETASLNLGEQYADKLLQPYMGIVGAKAETAFATKMFYDKVTSEGKEYHEIEGASHVDLYDKDVYIDKAVEKIVSFFNKHSSQQ